MTIREYWECFDSLDSPFNELDRADYSVDSVQVKKIYTAEKKIRKILTTHSNELIDKYEDEIFDPAGNFMVFRTKSNAFILERLEAESSGEEDALRKEEFRPAFSMDDDIDEYYKKFFTNLGFIKRIYWHLDDTDYFGVRSFVWRFPFFAKFYWGLFCVKVLKLRAGEQ